MVILRPSIIQNPCLNACDLVSFGIYSKPLEIPCLKSRNGIELKKLRKSSIRSSLALNPVSPEIFQENGSATKKKPKGPANSCPFSPLDFLERASIVYGNCTSIVYNDISYTWSETYTRCLKLASSISSLGIKKGDVVSILAPNIPAMYELQFAVPMSGAILNNINFRLDPRTLSVLLQHSEAKLIFVDFQATSLVVEALSLFPPKVQIPKLVLIEDDDLNNKSSSFFDNKFHNNYENMIKEGDSSFKLITPDSEWEPIVLNYTSGTTYAPKGVLHSHRSAFTMAIMGIIDWCVPKQPVYLWTLPIFHANGWGFCWGMAAVGGTNVCLRRGHDASSIYEAIHQHKVTHMCGAPVVLNMLSTYPKRQPLDSPVYIYTAGAPPPPAVLDRTESLGFVISHGYGLTETGGPAVTCAWKQDWDHLPQSERAQLKSRQGVRMVGFTEVDVVDFETGISIERNGIAIGEIVLRGGTVMLGYLKDPEGTSKCMKNDGWFYTGDVGVMHSDGYLEVKDRLKDVIICGGENISSVEVESILYKHPAVNEAAVVAKPDKFWGETPCAFISLKTDAEKMTEKELRDFCKENLPLYMVPRTVVIEDELPKTATGKIQKYLLREKARSLM
ncbi:2-methylpropanoate--CoA ligase CCL4-like [Nicotiana tabacum]|uniref:2-methylpropanoate--CoA ligase CCL4-like n=2 Tax=Nicotiana TaxID=4085 RepID=A0A1S4BPV3_TOBAC|nr:PREDICTED: probable acyl-activating enzyme 6 [Nicotiana sylvestris]XP_016490917.1 PREDICTED: probable acyl-activating enzyme 6 [Nicotiana tabacum]